MKTCAIRIAFNIQSERLDTIIVKCLIFQQNDFTFSRKAD
jgi:hypothetical protein